MTAPPTLVVATDGDLNAPDDDDNDVWNIERIHHAERVGNRYKLWMILTTEGLGHPRSRAGILTSLKAKKISFARVVLEAKEVF